MVKTIRDTGIIFLIILVACELTVRLFGYGPYHVQSYTIESEPQLCIIPHRQLGFGLRPGKFGVTINQGHSYQATHGPDSLRITHFHENEKHSDSLHEIAFHGCSFTYGMGVNDEESFPFLIQKELNSARVVNYGTPGFGTVQPWMILRSQILAGNPPDVFILNFAGFHAERNVLSPEFRQSLKHGFEKSNEEVKSLFASIRFPSIIAGRDGNIELKTTEWKNIYSDWPLRQYSALVNFIQTQTELHSGANRDKKKITEFLILDIASMCEKANIQFLLTGISNEPLTREILHFARQHGILTEDISLDLSNSEFSNLPYDSHPNARAHRLFRDKLVGKLTVD